MREEEIRKYAQVMKDCGISRLSITEKDVTIELERAVTPQTATAFVSEAISVRPADILEESDGTGVESPAEGAPVKSPLVGVFYSSPAENADPFVFEGDHVNAGQTLCIIEAMKLMNEICAEKSGVITKVCAKDAQVVEYGTTLFYLKEDPS